MIHRIFPLSLSHIEDFQRKLRKAVASDSRALWLPLQDLERIKANGWTALIDPDWQIYVETSWADSQKEAAQAQGTEAFSADIHKVVVVSRPEAEPTPNAIDSLLIRPDKVESPQEWLKFIQRHRKHPIYFEFLPWRPDFSHRYTTNEIHELTSFLSQKMPGFQPRAFPGLQCWDDRIDPELELEISKFTTKKFGPTPTRPRISVIVPSFNNANFLVAVLRQLLRQNYDPSKFEILLIDDGSSDDSFDRLSEYLNSNEIDVPVQIFYVPRRVHREAGDNHYRAGISRNFGARFALGDFLFFLDSDMLAPADTLRLVDKALEDFDIVQCKRMHLKPEFSNSEVDLERPLPPEALYIEEPHYWGKFFSLKRWEDAPGFWKYTCTYGLAIHRNLFKEIGGFKRVFTTYGFEDVDLGYEVYRRNGKFHLLDLFLYHLTPKASRSEYGHSKRRRRKLLARTAKTFYRQHLTDEVFSELGQLAQEGAGLQRMWMRSLRMFGVVQRD